MALINDFLKDILNFKLNVNALKTKYPNFRIDHLKKGSTLIHKGAKADKCYILISGSCDISNEFDFSELNTIDSQTAPNILGYYEELSNNPIYTSYVFTINECYYYEIDSKELDNLIRNDASLCYLVMKLMRKNAETVQSRNEQYHIFSGEDILGYYLYNTSKNKIPFELDMSREELAKILFINLRTLYRYIDKLKKMNYLTIYKRKIIINKDNYKNLDSRYHNVIL